MNNSVFPEIAKAVGAHKYLKRVPLAGGGYRYIYHDPKTYSVIGKVTAPTDLTSDVAQKTYVKNMVGARQALHELTNLTTRSIKLTKRGSKTAARTALRGAEDRMNTWKETAKRGVEGVVAGGASAKEKGYLTNYFAGAANVMQQEIGRAKRTMATY